MESIARQRQFCAHCLRTTRDYSTVVVDGRRFHYCYEPACQVHGYTVAAQERILAAAGVTA